VPRAFGRFLYSACSHRVDMASTSIRAHKRQTQKGRSSFPQRSIRNVESQDAEQAGPKILGEEISALVLCVQYRLPSHPGGRFPAALQDAATSFQHLLDLGVPASHIILSGDSTGGQLAVSLLRYISDYPKALPKSFCRATLESVGQLYGSRGLRSKPEQQD
jgi:alpha/beta hydrolase fold